MVHIFIHFLKPFLFMLLLLTAGTSGYMLVQDWSFIDSLYMTVITVTTVGFSEVHPLAEGGKIFTIIMVVGGVSFYGMVINVLFNTFLEENFREMLENNKIKENVSKLRDHYIICGGGRMAISIAEEFSRAKKAFVIIDNNDKAPVMQRRAEWNVMLADALLEETLVEAGLEYASGLASVLPTDADNLFVVLSARGLNSDVRIETRISLESSRSKMLQAGANKVLSPYIVGGAQMARSFLEPAVEEFLDIMLGKSDYEFEMVVQPIDSDMENNGKMIMESDFRKKGFIIIGVKNQTGRFTFAPSSEYRLQKGDEILLLGKSNLKKA